MIKFLVDIIEFAADLQKSYGKTVVFLTLLSWLCSIATLATAIVALVRFLQM